MRYIPLKRRGHLRVEVADTAARPELADALNRALAELASVFEKAPAGPSEVEIECVLGTDAAGDLVVRDGAAGLFRVRMTFSPNVVPPQ